MPINVLSSLQMTAEAMGRRMGMKVIVGGSQAYTNGKTIFIPTLNDTNNADALARGYIDHEAAHVAITDFSVPNTIWTNIIEDVRIEVERSKLYPGIRKNIATLIDLLVQKGEYLKWDKNQPKELLAAWISMRARVNAGYTNLSRKANKAEKDAKAAFGEKFYNRILDIIARIPLCRSTRDAYDLGQEIEKVIQDESKDNKSQDDKSKNSNKGDGSGEKSKKKSEQSDKDSGSDPGSDSDSDADSDPDADSQDESKDNKSQDDKSENSNKGDGSGKKSKKKSEQSDKDSGSDPGSGSDSDADSDPDADSQDESKDNKSQDDKSENSNKGDGSGKKSKKKSEQSDKDSGSDPGSDTRPMLKALADASDPTNADIGQHIAQAMEAIAEQVEEMQPTLDTMPCPEETNHAIPSDVYNIPPVGGIVAQIKGLLQSQKVRYSAETVAGQKLSLHAPSKVACKTPDTRLFQKREPKRDLNTAVAILLDSSGSMSDDNCISIASAGCYVAAHAMDMNNIPCLVGVFPYIQILKNFDVRASTKMLVTPSGGTPIAEALIWVAGKLLPRKEKRKIVVIITDGDPNSKTLARDAIERMNTLYGIETYLIAIGPYAAFHVDSWFKNARRRRLINAVGEFPKALLEVLRDGLTKQF